MTKKYLLYIHDPLFADEPKKSQLVNNLLESHYHGTVGGETREEVVERINKKIAEIPKRCAGHAMRWDCGLPGCKYGS